MSYLIHMWTLPTSCYSFAHNIIVKRITLHWQWSHYNFISLPFRGEPCLYLHDICQNGGQCQSHGVGYWCDCAVGWTGPHCETCMPGYPPVSSQVTPVVLVTGQPAVQLRMERDACNNTWIVSGDDVIRGQGRIQEVHLDCEWRWCY